MADCRAGMTWLLRLVAAVVGLLLPVVPAQVHAVETPAGVSAYTYDSQHRPALLTDTATERGPPASYGRGSAHVADYHWSCGDQARPEGATSGATTACNAPAEFVQVTRATGMTQPSVQGDAGALLSLGRSDVAANGGSRIAANQAAGNAARDALAAAHPGSLIEQSFTTTAGVRRLDILTQGLVGIESKVGRTSLTATTRSQIAKDSLLLRNGDVNGIEWVFSRSGVTGQIGPTGPLASALDKAGISWSLAP